MMLILKIKRKGGNPYKPVLIMVIKNTITEQKYIS